MADKAIQTLTEATTPLSGDELFVLQQSNQAKKIEAQDFVEFLATALHGHGGIANITYTGPTDPLHPLDGTVTITLADNTTASFTIKNGNGIKNVTTTKTDLTTRVLMTFDDNTSEYFDVDDGRGITNISWAATGTPGTGMKHIGIIEYNDGTTSQFEFRDGADGLPGPPTYVWFKWAQESPNADSDMQDSVGPYIGIYSGLSSTAPTTYNSYVWYRYKGETGDPGASVTSVEYSGTSGLIDTYTIKLSDGNEGGTFNVTNAKSITSITKISGTGAAGTTDVYRITYNTGDTFNFSIYNGANGEGSVSSVSGIQADGNGNVPQVYSGNGAPTASTEGQENQLYYDLIGGTMYFCAGTNGNDYLWYGTTVAVDNAFSSVSTNPVQNAVITAKVGTTSLNTTATDLSGAVNEVLGAIPSASTATPQKDGTGAAGSGTTWARGNHVHPLNVATSGVPASLGQNAALGSATTYAKTDHVHPYPTAAQVGAVSSSDVKFKIYKSVEDLPGLEAGSATIYGAYSAMPAYSVLIANSGDFSSNELPGSVYGTVEIIKVLANGARGVITLYGKLQSHGDYRKYITAENSPETSWVRIPSDVVSGTVTKVFEGTFTNDATTLQCNGNMALLNLNVRYSTGFSTEGWTDLYSVSPAPINTVYFSLDFQGKSATVRILSASDSSKPGYVQILAHTVAYTSYARYVIPYFY